MHAAVVEASARAATALAASIQPQVQLPGVAVKLHGSLLVDRMLTFYFPDGPQQVCCCDSSCKALGRCQRKYTHVRPLHIN